MANFDHRQPHYTGKISAIISTRADLARKGVTPKRGRESPHGILRRPLKSTANEFHRNRHRRSSFVVTYRDNISQAQRRELIRRNQKTKSE